MSDVTNRARIGTRFGARFTSVSVITETERKRAPKHAPNRAQFATSDITLRVNLEKNFAISPIINLNKGAKK